MTDVLYSYGFICGRCVEDEVRVVSVGALVTFVALLYCRVMGISSVLVFFFFFFKQKTAYEI